MTEEKIETRGRKSRLQIGIRQKDDRSGYSRIRSQLRSIRQQLEASGGQFASVKLTKDLADAVHIARVFGAGYTYNLHGKTLVVTPSQTADNAPIETLLTAAAENIPAPFTVQIPEFPEKSSRY